MMVHVQYLRSGRFRGYGLLEVALGIALAALLVAGAMMYFQNAHNERLANSSVEQVAVIVSAVHTMYNGIIISESNGVLSRRATVAQAVQGCNATSNSIHWDFK